MFSSVPEQRKEVEFIPPPRPPMQKLLTPNHAPYFTYNRVPWAFKLRKEVRFYGLLKAASVDIIK